MEKANAEIVAQVLGEKVIETLEQQEEELDAQIKKLEDANDEEWECIRAKRLQKMRQQAEKNNELRANGHGEYTTLNDTREFFDLMKKSENLVVHFFTHANQFCQIIDGHLERLAQRHIETRFIRIDAEKSEFLVDRLGVWMIPCIALIKKQKVVKMVQGLDEFGGTENFTTSFLAYYISLHQVLKYEGTEPENPLDTCGDLYNKVGPNPGQHKQGSNNIRQTIYYDSDLSENEDN